MSIPHISSSSSSQSTCIWWLRGYCKYGDSCKYLHGKDINARRGKFTEPQKYKLEYGSNGSNAEHRRPSASGARGGNGRSRGGNGTPVYTLPRPPICRYWKAGNCTKAEECQFRHTPEVSQVSHSDQEFEYAFPSTKTRVCSYWEAGDCARGEHCRFLHDPKIASASQVATSQQLEMALEKANQEHNRRLEQEKAAHRVREAVAQKIQHQEETFITILNSIEQHYMERRAEVEAGVHGAGKVAERRQHSLSMEKAKEDYKLWLLSQETTKYERRVAEARENHALALKGPNKEYKRRLAEEAAAVEASKTAAREHQRQLQALRNEEAEITEQYAVLGGSSLITCRAGIDVQSVVTGFDISRIIIKNLPRNIKHKEISDILVRYGMESSDFFVFDVRFRKNCQEATVFAITDHGREIAVGLEDTEFRGRILTFEVSESPNGSAVESSPMSLQYETIVALLQYEAQKRKWDALSEDLTGSNAHVQISTVEDQKTVLICVSGQDKKAVGLLKVRVEGMAAGERLDSNYWHPSFLTPDGEAFFEQIYKDKKVYVRCDLKFRALRLYGETDDALEEVRQMIKEEINRLARLETTVTLDQKSIGFFIRQGLGRLQELIGEENVVLNFVPERCKITIKGGEEERHHLNRLIRESKAAQTMEQVDPEKDEKVTCPICYDEVSHPEQLGCGHIYCSGCLRLYLASAPETKTFPLLCLGDEAACKTPISLPLIRRFMTPQAFRALVEAAFRLYLDQHSQELKYCTTPDCQQIYRQSPEARILQCPSCFSSICSACDDEPHEGMTCKERRDQKISSEQERLFNEWVDGHGKRCPKCQSVIEKNDGCNRITCRCGANFCWKCGQGFESGEIYQHLNTAHGGYYG